jgi:hypothetical protein
MSTDPTSFHPHKGSDPLWQRNEVLRRAGILAGVVLLGRPGRALAGQPAADRTADALVALVAREYAAAAGYREAGGKLFERLAANCDAHVGALRSQLDSVGREPPTPGPAADVGDGVALERGFVAAYRRSLGDLYDPATKRTAATIMAGHAQHLVVLLDNPMDGLGETS